MGGSLVGNKGPDRMTASQDGDHRATIREILDDIDRHSAKPNTFCMDAGRMSAPPRNRQLAIRGGAIPNPIKARIMSQADVIIDPRFSDIGTSCPG